MSAASLSLGNPILERVYSATTPEESRKAYDEWAATYDADINKQGYIAPRLCAEAVAQHGNINGDILDAGCGTGADGLELAKLGAKSIDGIDLSQGMLKMAEKTTVYRKLETADMSKKLEIRDAVYEAVVCVGTLTEGHVGPDPALKEFVRVVKPGGVVVATILETIWERDGYEAEVERLVKDNQVEVISKQVEKYRTSSDIGGRVLILRKA